MHLRVARDVAMVMAPAAAETVMTRAHVVTTRAHVAHEPVVPRAKVATRAAVLLVPVAMTVVAPAQSVPLDHQRSRCTATHS